MCIRDRCMHYPTEKLSSSSYAAYFRLLFYIPDVYKRQASHIPNMSKPSKARKRTKRILNGLQTSTNLTLSDALLSLLRISASSENLPDIASSWSASVSYTHLLKPDRTTALAFLRSCDFSACVTGCLEDVRSSCKNGLAGTLTCPPRFPVLAA